MYKKEFDKSHHTFLEGKGETFSNLETGELLQVEKEHLQNLTASNIHNGERPNAFPLRWRTGKDVSSHSFIQPNTESSKF